MKIFKQLTHIKNPFQTEMQEIEKGTSPVLITGLGEMHKAHLIAGIYETHRRPIVLIASDAAEALRQGTEIETLLNKKVIYFKHHDWNFYTQSGVSFENQQEKIAALYQMEQEKCAIVITTPEALMAKTMPKQQMQSAVKKLKKGDNQNQEKLVAHLLDLGFSRAEKVEGRGQFAVRGGILDLFSTAEAFPVRIEFWGDEIDTMAFFDLQTQRRTKEIQKICILPTAENLPAFHKNGREGLQKDLSLLLEKTKKQKEPFEPLIQTIESDIACLETKRTLGACDRYMSLLYPEKSSIFDYMQADTLMIGSELGRISEKAKRHSKEQADSIEAAIDAGFLAGSCAKMTISWSEVMQQVEKHQTLVLDQFAGSSFGTAFVPSAIYSILAKQLPGYNGNLEMLEQDIAHYQKSAYTTVLLCATEKRAKELDEYFHTKNKKSVLVLSKEEICLQSDLIISVGGISFGLEYPSIKLVILSDIGGKKQDKNRRKLTKKKGKPLERYTDLSPGDLVVHEHHGIGRFVEMQTMLIDGMKKDYIKIAYHGTDSLYVPAVQLDLVSKYIGSGGQERVVKLSKMGGTDWNRARSRAKGAAKDLAKGLIALYAERMRQKGYAFAPDSAWQREFEEKFEYAETNDQLLAVEDIKRDMESSLPMDRLLCGDVGYGKTEVALRAAMKCILEGKQAAILVPTTVLAQQHYQTALRRFHGYPIQIEVLNRYKTATQAKKILETLEKGKIDLIIGTHKIIQKQIKFHDLGLLIVDEEQRFGVSHKERLKELSHNVDVLTLSATPIPRTLNMALSGIRDMSTLEEPPQNRHPIQTYVMEHNWPVIIDAIRREIDRGGQVFYLHNRVETIDRVANRIREQMGEVEIAVAHGRMDENQLTHAMERMMSGEANILVCTTIIETGIDIPNVNTLIIENADTMGLAQLHQIRGRVGRSNRAAYAYFTYRENKILTEISAKRLAAIREFVSFNSGFKIALRDLEIRGAGNLLGSEQSGHLVSVGYDMYLKLLNEAVLEARNEKIERRTECTADLSVNASIPQTYIAQTEQRMDLYRKIAQIRTEDDITDVIDELIDRYGEPPKTVMTLMQVAKLRNKATEAGIIELTQKGRNLQISFDQEAFHLEIISELFELPAFRGRIKILAGEIPCIRLSLSGAKDVMEEAFAFIAAWMAGNKS